MPDQREIALNHLKLHGPSLPVNIAKALNTNILFASAVLSELTSNKKILFTHAAIGGSKVYYLKGQEAQVGEKVYPSLKGKEKSAYELLRDTKVLRDVELEPWQRIALRELKDFAIPLTVSLGSQAELFWKFHIITDEEAKPLIEQYIIREEPQQVAAPIQEQVQEQKVEPKPDPEETKREMERVMQSLKEELLKEIRQQPIPVQEVQQEVEEEPEIEEIKEVEKPKPKKVIKEETKQEVLPEVKPKKPEGKFYTQIKEHLESNKIEILKEEMIKKDKEFDFIVKIPSALGSLVYYLKAKDKKLINEADISLAHSEGQVKKLPCILLTTGSMNKKASLLVEQKLQGQLVFKEL